MKHFLLISFTLFSICAHAQKPDFDTLNVNNWSIPFSTASSHGWDHVGKAKSICPKEEGIPSIFAFSLWFGGLDSGEIRATAATYLQNGTDFFYGPLKDDGTATGTPTNDPWNKVYKLQRWEVEKHIQGKGTSQNIKNWPAHGNSAFGEPENIAPFVDVNKNGIYEPNKGDYPEMKGDQMLYIVNNESERTKRQAGGPAMGIEIHTRAYAFACTDNEALNNTVFVEYRLFNKSKVNYDSFFVGFWADTDLGYAYDDYVGSNPELGCFYTYNGDNQDENHFKNYLPIVSFYPLNDKLDYFLYYENSFTTNGNPAGRNFTDHYNYLRGRWKNNSPILFGSDGINVLNSKPTKFMFPSKPFERGEGVWNETTANRQPADRRVMGSTGPYTLKMSDTLVSTWAISFHRDISGRTMDAYTLMEKQIPLIKKQFNNGFKNPCSPKTGASISEAKMQAIQLFPNPTNDIVSIASSKEIKSS
ncbi:MAG: hypothetical protein KDC92_17635, partial [Bacteroidetes bacterium]|nr:hypothetical protein [Bacteroidota bacterium]